MPTINGQWIPPSQLIAEMGLAAYKQQFEPWDVDPMMTTKRKAAPKKAETKEDFEVPTTPLDAREGFTFGCDPEIFITKNGVPVTAEGLIPGTKIAPHPVQDETGETVGAVQVDGMAAEITIPPVNTFRDFNRYIEGTIGILKKMLPPEHDLLFVPAVTFGEEEFNSAPDKAKELGCSPDYNAWEGTVNPPPKDPDNPFLRTASGHLHIGWTQGADLSDAQHVMNCCDIVKQLDWYLGGWSLAIDKDPARRRLYGRAGACRLKDYGVEYRVLSNFWITSRDRRLAVWNRMQQAIDTMAKGFIPERADPAYNKLLRVCIDQTEMNSTLMAAFSFPLKTLTQSPNRLRSYSV
jgi:hypothetical protein